MEFIPGNEHLNKIIVRVYALIINNEHEVLLSDEFQVNMKMTKFPGGGLKLGEGTINCLKREAFEEFGQEVEIVKHFYTTDFFQQAFFYNNAQIISVYYIAKFREKIKFKISKIHFDFENEINGSQSFRWVKIKSLNPEDLTFPIDGKIIEKLKRFEFNKNS